MNESVKYRLQNQYGQLEYLVRGLTDEFLRKEHISGKWSIHEHIAHLGRYQEFFVERINLILNLEKPVFGRYRADSDPLYENWVQSDTKAIIAKAKAYRRDLSEMIIGLDQKQLIRTGTHPRLGLMNIVEWTEFFLLHESHHLYSIFWLNYENRRD